MAGTELGNEIREGFAKMGGAVRLAGQRKNLEDVAKQGYVAFRNPNAVAMFHADPEHVDWHCQFVDGEYRFFPPEHKKAELLARLQNFDQIYEAAIEADTKKDGLTSQAVQEEKPVVKEEAVVVDTKEVVQTYKRELADSTKSTFVSVTVLADDPSKCKYRLVSTDKSSGEKRIVQEFVTEFEGKFAMEIVPSIYNQFMGGLPVIDYEKGEENQRMLAMQAMEGAKQMAFGNLTESQIALIRSMKQFVDGQYFNFAEEQSKGRTK